MCGRFTLRTPASVLIEMFGLGPGELQLPLFEPRYNIAPSQSIWAVREPATADQQDRSTADTPGPREAVQLHWGLIPSWAKDAAIGNRMINARGETVAEKPAYRTAFRRQRCLIPIDGYYEWQKGGSGPKQPYYFHRADNRPFALAGLWEQWQAPPPSATSDSAPPRGPAQQSLFEETDESRASGSEDDGVIESCTIITTTPNDLTAEIHDRMPVILQPEQYDAWLDRSQQDADTLRPLLAPLPDKGFLDKGILIAEPVSTFVNKPSNDGLACIEPV